MCVSVCSVSICPNACGDPKLHFTFVRISFHPNEIIKISVPVCGKSNIQMIINTQDA